MGKGSQTNSKSIERVKLRILSNLIEINSFLSQTPDLKKILTKILKVAAKFLGYDRATLYLYQEETKTLECKALYGFPRDKAKFALENPYFVDRHDCIETKILKTGQWIFVSNHAKDPRMTKIDKKVAERQKIVSRLVVPIKVKGKVIGVMGVLMDKIKEDVTDYEIKAASLFANQAGILIENARLQEINAKRLSYFLELQKLNKKISSASSLNNLIKIILKGAVKLTRAESGSIWCLNEFKESFLPKLWVGYDKEGLIFDFRRINEFTSAGIALKMESGKWFYLDDTDIDTLFFPKPTFAESELLLPLSLGERIIGFLKVNSSKKGAFKEPEREVLSLLASQASKAIESMLFYERMRKEKELSENIIKNSINGILLIDDDKKIILLNPRAERILGVRLRDVKGKSIEEFLNGSPLLEFVANSMVKGTKIFGQEMRYKKGEKNLVLNVGFFKIPSRRSSKKGTSVIILQDVTEKKMIEEHMKKVEKLAALGHLAAGVAHEIRNPLAGMLAAVQNLSCNGNGERNSKELLAIENEIYRVEDLIKEILNFARPSDLNLSCEDINKIVKDSVSLLKKQTKFSNVSINLNLKENIPCVMVDIKKMEQVFLNVMINGIEASRRSPTIDVFTSFEEGMVKVRFRDNGSGIKKKDIKHIFDPFYTTKPKGIGLGLSISHRIVEDHKGSIEVESTGKKGTTFLISLPGVLR